MYICMGVIMVTKKQSNITTSEHTKKRGEEKGGGTGRETEHK